MSQNNRSCLPVFLINTFFISRCSLRSDCQDAAKDPLYWISYKSGRCTTITTVTPNELQRTTARTVSIEPERYCEHVYGTVAVSTQFTKEWL